MVTKIDIKDIAAYSAPVIVSYTLALLNKYNEECVFKIISKGKFENEKSRGFDKFIARSDLHNNGILKDNALIISCKIHINLDTINVKHFKTYLSKLSSDEKMIEGKMKPNITSLYNLNLVEIFETNMFSDIMLILDEETFYAHKIILCSASPVFMEIFKNLKGQITSVDIKDMTPNMMREMLRYIYTGRVESLADKAHELVGAAHKYNIRGLKNECEKSLCSELNLDNLLDMLIIATSYDLAELYKKISNLFVLNKSEIVSTQKYQEMTILEPNIMLNLFTSLAAGKGS